MTTLNPLYISSTPLQWYFVDKDTAEALAGGVVTFYAQDDQSVLKPIYQLDNSSPTGFSILNNPIHLTSVGTFSDDNGNDIIPYFYPYNVDGDSELYYVTVYSAQGVLQFTREDWPPNMGEAPAPAAQNEVLNYVANGQFLLHNDHPVVNNNVVTDERDIVTYIAQGGWTFEQEFGATSTDTISFIRELNASPNPIVDANPRYYVQIATTGSDANYSRKDLCLKFPDVNKFAGNTNTFAWYGAATSGGTPEVTIILRQYFGSGSSTATGSGNIIETIIGTQVITATNNELYQISIPFPENIGDSVSPTVDDDYLQICLRLPNSAQTVQFTDYVLTPGIVTITAFPQTPNSDFIRDSTIGYLPTPASNGSQLYLPLILGNTGALYDDSRIGSVYGAFYSAAYAANFSVLLCDSTAYPSSGYSNLGIPYSRLANRLIANSPVANTPLFGTGATFVTVTSSTNTFTITYNDGGTPSTPPDPATSGFTGPTGSPPAYIFTIPALPTASTYFTFQTDEMPFRAFAVWYQIGASAAPIVAGSPTLIPVVLIGTESPTQVAVKTLIAINAYQFATPNLLGQFLRGYDPTATIDPDNATRTIAAIGFTGSSFGTLEQQAFLAHTHTYDRYSTPSGGTIFAGGTPYQPLYTGTPTSSTGGSETRPINTAVNYFIYY